MHFWDYGNAFLLEANRAGIFKYHIWLPQTRTDARTIQVSHVLTVQVLQFRSQVRCLERSLTPPTCNTSWGESANCSLSNMTFCMQKILLTFLPLHLLLSPLCSSSPLLSSPLLSSPLLSLPPSFLMNHLTYRSFHCHITSPYPGSAANYCTRRKF